MAGTQTLRLKSRHNISKKMRIVKTVAFFVLLTGIVVGVYLFGTSRVFALKDVSFQGNHNLTADDLRTIGSIENGENLFKLSSRDKAMSLMKSPWIKDVSIRKEFPRTLMVKISEAVPQAILKTKDKLLLVDTEGTVLEELKGKREFFLPVIIGSNEDRGAAFQDALNLAGVIQDKGIMSSAKQVEITGYERGVEDIAVSIDGLMVKLGEDNYPEKLDMFIELADEIKKRMSDVDYYVDMRFNDRVVVKPIIAADKHPLHKGGA